jgi:SAM-dependent methyltransferase
MSRPFRRYAAVYDLFYRDKDYDGEASYLLGKLRERGLPERKILELGAGTGRHAVCFARAGCAVTGVERSPEMLKAARARFAEAAKGLRLSGMPVPRALSGDARGVRLGRRFDSVVALFHVINYQRSADEIRRVFRTARAHLSAAGLFIFDSWYGPGTIKRPPSVRVRKVRCGDMAAVRMAVPHALPGDRIAVEYAFSVTGGPGNRTERFTETHIMKPLSLFEVEGMAGECGLRVLEASEWRTERRLTPDVWNVCFVLGGVR